jgi:hypothetical protein
MRLRNGDLDFDIRSHKGYEYMVHNVSADGEFVKGCCWDVNNIKSTSNY